MTEIKLTSAFVDLLRLKNLLNQNLILLADDGGGKYSLHGGACSIGESFTIVSLPQPDPTYPIKLANQQKIAFWTSDYDLTFCEPGLTLDYRNGSIQMKDRSRFIDGGVQIADGQQVLAAFKQGDKKPATDC
ncbi:iron-sulfur cluster biosynthesis family protein [Lapidilactobacillus wuchangensis]|uniref:iron-sulfur cluster biosynthesis family protein n=1 Tax=Lapidilactobacillus wuchangensis TaxID=2486001 RepID=UPI000F7871AD|nr:iron-sulfur cluster biosynthesis family protein [Lapidilactobacillus wuchangensis]